MFEDLLQLFWLFTNQIERIWYDLPQITLPYFVVHPLLTTQAFTIYRFEEHYEVPIGKRPKMSW